MDRPAPPSSRPPRLALRPPSTSAVAENCDSCTPPTTRDSSPSPSLSPTPALSACPPLSRSFSANSSSEYASSAASTISQPSVASRSSSASAALRRRGYVRPQGVSFAPSAGNRDSVLSLGSIAHLQYYFARTGLLDGKGAQLAKDDRGKPGIGGAPRIRRSSNESSDLGYCPDSSPEDTLQEAEPVMLPPTVSTYSHRTPYVPPPPDSQALRRGLTAALEDAKRALHRVSAEIDDQLSCMMQEDSKGRDSKTKGLSGVFADGAPNSLPQPSGWHEIQGLHILDVITLAIRAAKMYYTSHEDPSRLYGIKSERQLREELLGIMDVLKRMAGRDFAEGVRPEELRAITLWVNGIEAFLAEEQELDKQEAEQRANWSWLEGSWDGREREREHLFLSSFHAGEALPPWTPIDPNDPKPTPFLEVFRTGLFLVRLHNTLLKKSKRQFGDIKTFHTDVAKPYRCAENLRFWIKAAEIRWETKLKLNVSGVVNGKEETYPDFDAAILQWCRVVREELTREWKEASSKPQESPICL